MSKTNAATGSKELVLWCDPVAKLGEKKISVDEIMDGGAVVKAKLKSFIIDILDQIDNSGLEEVELLLVLLAKYDTSEVVRLKWRRTQIGQQFKSTYVEAKEAFLRKGF